MRRYTKTAHFLPEHGSGLYKERRQKIARYPGAPLCTYRFLRLFPTLAVFRAAHIGLNRYNRLLYRKQPIRLRLVPDLYRVVLKYSSAVLPN